jgi:hypothetical protein
VASPKTSTEIGTRGPTSFELDAKVLSWLEKLLAPLAEQELETLCELS